MSRLTGFGAPLRGRCVAEDAGRKKASQQQQAEVGEMRPNVRQTGVSDGDWPVLAMHLPHRLIFMLHYA